MRDRGAAAVLTILVAVAVSWSVAVAIVAVAGEAGDAGRAQIAADAGALAGVTGGRQVAGEVVRRNGGAVEGYRVEAVAGYRRVTITVRVGNRVAVARATDEP